MDFCNRAIKYLLRKRKNTIILLLILIVIYSMVLISINILRTTNDVITSMKSETNTQIIVSNTKKDNEVTSEMIENILRIGNIKNVKKYGTGYAYPDNFIQNQQGTKLKNNLDDMVYIIALDDISLDTKFADDVIYLIDGNKELNKQIIIDYKLAEANNMNVGDNVILKNSSEKKVTVQIAGIYRAKENEENQSARIASIYRIENCIYIDYDTAKELLEDELKCDTCYFSLKNPALANNTVDEIKQIINDGYSVKIADNLYKSLESSMNKTVNIVGIMLIFSVITAVCIITILLSMWIKNRIKEICILNVLGESKYKIILQLIVEGTILFLLASVISIFSSNFIIEEVHNNLFTDNIFMSQVSQSFQVIDIILMEILGYIILIICTLISVIPVLRMKPKDILSMAD